MIKKDICYEYFEWMISLIRDERHPNEKYSKLLSFLYDTEFYWTMENDRNRAIDGEDLRIIFANDSGHTERNVLLSLNRPCSVLEMMVALSRRCEDHIMDDPDMGDRTGQWFWSMIENLGLDCVDDYNFDADHTGRVVDRFLERRYERNGNGGLFTVTSYSKDLRRVEIWYQAMWQTCRSCLKASVFSPPPFPAEWVTQMDFTGRRCSPSHWCCSCLLC